MDIFKSINLALPLFLQDSTDDYERSLVIKLGLSLRDNYSLEVASKMIIGSLNSSDLLIQYSIMYLAIFELKINHKLVEVFLFKLLSRKDINNFIIISTVELLESVIANKPNQAQISRLKQIIEFFLGNAQTYKEKAMKAAFTKAINGFKIDKQNSNQDLVFSTANSESIEVNDKEITKIRNACKEIQYNTAPNFDINRLCSHSDMKYLKEAFSSLSKLDFSKEEPEEEFLPLEDIPQSDSDEYEIELEEIDITDVYSIPKEQSNNITDQELLKEPLPQMQLSKGEKPIKKIFSPNPSPLSTPKRKRGRVQNKHKNLKIEKVVDDLYISLESIKKKPILNRQYLLVEAPNPKFKICMLDSFEYFKARHKKTHQ
jgi:hypothetical protein